MITPLGKRLHVNTPRFGVYDLEWFPGTYKLRLFGVLDDRGRYHRFGDVGSALRFMRTKGKMVWYAHFGGAADTAFVVEEILNHSLHAKAILAGGSGIVALRIGDVTLADSFRLLPGKLAEIGESLGLAKLDYKCPTCEHPPEHPCAPYAPYDELCEYNRRDCEIVKLAIEKLSAFIATFSGARLRLTLASTALEVFRRHFLKESVTTMASANELAVDSYKASRVENFERECHDVWDFDINSSFPASMTVGPVPGQVLSVYPDPAKHDLATVRARVRVPSHCSIPPLPYRDGTRLWHPTGTWEGVFTSTELRYLEETGGTILRVYDGYAYAPLHGLDEYARVLYERRRTEKDPFTRYALKILMNSLYGKFGEREDREEWIIGARFPIEGATEVMPGCLRVNTKGDVPHRWVPISAEITARSRIELTRWLVKAVRAGGRVYYCDTDSIVTNVQLPTGDGLGELKGTPIKEGYYLSPKLYAVKDEQGIYKVRAKGFPRLTFDQFRSLARGESVKVRRMARFRESMREGDVTPRDMVVDKAIRRIVPKRNGLRAWTVDEIERGLPYE